METTTTLTTESTATTTAVTAARSFADQTAGREGVQPLHLRTRRSRSAVHSSTTWSPTPRGSPSSGRGPARFNILVQGVIWLLFLPWMICLWMWTLPLAVPIRFVLVIAALAWTNWLLWPWK